MMTITSAARSKGSVGSPLPITIPALGRQGVAFREGELSLIAGASGIGKTVIAQWNAVFSHVPTLYMSADSHQGTMATRTAAMRSGLPVDICEEQIEEGVGRAWDELRAANHIRWCFDPSPSPDDILGEVAAFATAWGSYPKLIVVDNLRNIDAAGEDMGAGMQSSMKFLHELPRRTGAHVQVLHHVVGEYDSGDKIVPQGGLEQKVSKLPEVILTLHKPSFKQLRVAVIKNRNPMGRHEQPASLDGSVGFYLATELSQMQIDGE